ncbi:MAG: lysoplasmalogenase [Deltaproteobacteria bacterium HGW-Deltaproteobacteria-11]|nr:MAG: lysoplasmalogenase [Deltaproteobacteria bacterium HGW-Deltaproteobacteria-11]
MNVNIAIIILALPLLVGLLFFTKKESTRGVIMTKPLLSALFILAAISVPHTNPNYYGFILAGLLFCMAGDVFLIFFLSRKLFMVGLVSFLAGHIMYSIAFFSMGSPGKLIVIITALCLAISVTVFIWIRPYLGAMIIPVIAYIAIITMMVIGAASLVGNEHLNFTGRALVFCGAILFYLSDIFVARHRFVKKEYINRLAGLPMYYAAQFMIACSIGFI